MIEENANFNLNLDKLDFKRLNNTNKQQDLIFYPENNLKELISNNYFNIK